MSLGVDGSNASVPSLNTMSVAVPSASLSVPNSSPDAVSHRTIVSRVLGEQTVSSDAILRFPEGLHGFEAFREFALVQAARDGFWWLQCTEEAELAFLLVDPFQAAPGYQVDLKAGDEHFLELAAPEDALILTVVTLPSSKGASATTNLRGPIVINARRRLARQIVSAVDAHSFQAPITL